MKRTLIITAVLIGFVTITILGFWLAGVIWNSSLPMWLKIWFLTN